MNKLTVKDLRVGNTVYIEDKDIFGNLRLQKATILQFLVKDFILVRYDYADEDSFNIVAVAYLDNWLLPDTPKVQKFAEKLEQLKAQTEKIRHDLDDIWLEFVGEAMDE